MLLRRRMIGEETDPFANYVKLRTRNSTSASTLNNILNTAADEQSVDKMYIDGVEVTPTYSYVFSDSNYHDVYILYKDTTKVGGLWQGNYTANFCDIPENYYIFSQGALRGHGASQNYNTIIRSNVMPTFGSYNFIGWTVGHLWVPDHLIEDYKLVVGTALGANYQRLHKLSDWTG